MAKKKNKMPAEGFDYVRVKPGFRIEYGEDIFEGGDLVELPHELAKHHVEEAGNATWYGAELPPAVGVLKLSEGEDVTQERITAKLIAKRKAEVEAAEAEEEADEDSAEDQNEGE